MTTVRDICSDALLELGVLAIGEAMAAEDAQFAFRTLNRMLSKWSIEDLMVYTTDRQSFNFIAGKQTYTLGTGGDFNIPRPVRIQMASVLINSTRPLEIPLQIITDEERRNLTVATTPSTWPTKLWVKGDMPLNNLFFWPLPQDSTVQAVLYTWGKLGSLTDLNTDVILPEGYEEAIVTNLAIWLAGSYGVPPNQVLGSRALSSKAAIESINIDPLYASFENSFSGRATAIATNGFQVDR